MSTYAAAVMVAGLGLVTTIGASNSDAIVGNIYLSILYTNFWHFSKLCSVDTCDSIQYFCDVGVSHAVDQRLTLFMHIVPRL